MPETSLNSAKLYRARKIVTMNPAQPIADHILVREGRILAVGDESIKQIFDGTLVDDRFAKKIVLPGFVEGHAHSMEGSLWSKTYCGFFDRMDPQGRVWKGLKSLDAILDKLKEADRAMEDPNQPLAGWQLDPIYLGNQEVTRQDLDKVSATRPIGLLHASGHILNVNSKGLELAGFLNPGINHPGINLGSDGLPTGTLKGPEVMTPAGKHVGFERNLLDSDEVGLRNFGKLCVRTGTTTITDLASRLDEGTVETMLKVTGEANFPACLVPLKFFMGLSPKDLVAEVLRLKKLSTERLKLGRIKIVADGSIQGFSARLRWPGYHNGAPNGLWYIAPEQLSEIFHLALEAGVQVHTHTNGDQATELVLETLLPALRKHPHPDHRFTLQHCQLADHAQLAQAAKLGMCVNMFANHHFYWGDQHYELTVGPERAQRMNACRSALDLGLPLAIHSDAPITPLAPLFTAWAAVTRQTASGRTQGQNECIRVDEALWAITMGAAYTLHLEGEVGSLEVGKRADLAILDEDPTSCAPEDLKNIPVWGTMQGGRIFPAQAL